MENSVNAIKHRPRTRMCIDGCAETVQKYEKISISSGTKISDLQQQDVGTYLGQCVGLLGLSTEKTQ